VQFIDEVSGPGKAKHAAKTAKNRRE